MSYSVYAMLLVTLFIFNEVHLSIQDSFIVNGWYIISYVGAIMKNTCLKQYFTQIKLKFDT